MNSSNDAVFAQSRLRMVDSQLRGRGIRDERVLGAMARVPRHVFVGERFRAQAYEDHPVPIAEDQTISQPYIVALMLQTLGLTPSDRVLEIGSGSGYVTALLAELAAEVISIERHATLAEHAQTILQELGYGNVRVIVADGTNGYPERAPYDAILVSAAAAEVPRALPEQLANAGRMVIPVGSPDSQQLQFIQNRDGFLITTPGDLCRFVPLISESSA